MPKKTGFIKTHRPMFAKSKFEQRWGEPAYKIAQREDVSITSIHMRVRNYGSPYQRKAKPSLAEELTGKTFYELGIEYEMHPFTAYQRLTKYGKVDCEAEMTDNFTKTKSGHPLWNDGSWKTDSKYTRERPWLMPEHHNYAEFKAQFEEK
tara:strand:+ start:4017 stop:4466 length:450 start_codon:yes stop_codon:yes gene_type:complete